MKPFTNWSMFAPEKKGGMVFPLTPTKEKALYQIVKDLPVVWHSTTPRNFECQQGCFKCCSMCWFNADELSKLPSKYHPSIDGNLIRTKNEKCVFYDSNRAFRCTLREYRPLRCKIYPFEPILDTSRNSIVILAHDVMIWGGKPVEEPSCLCYGLGNGKDVSEEVMEQCREYLLHCIVEQSHSRFLWMGKAEAFIDKRALYRRQNPLYRTFAQAHAARLHAVQTLTPDEFDRQMLAGLV